MSESSAGEEFLLLPVREESLLLPVREGPSDEESNGFFAGRFRAPEELDIWHYHTIELIFVHNQKDDLDT